MSLKITKAKIKSIGCTVQHPHLQPSTSPTWLQLTYTNTFHSRKFRKKHACTLYPHNSYWSGEKKFPKVIVTLLFPHLISLS